MCRPIRRENSSRDLPMTSGLVLKGSARSGERGKVRWEELELDGNEVTRFDAAGAAVASPSSESQQQKAKETPPETYLGMSR